MKHLRWSIVFASFALLSATALAQGDCPALVESALAATEQMCEATGRNQVCYGNALLEVEPEPSTDTFEFSQPGDLLGLELVQNLSLSPMDTSENVWGVALMNVQASLPDSLPGQNVTFLMFGDVEVRVPTNTEPITVDVTASGGLNIRSGPSTTNTIIGSLAAGQTVSASGRLEDGTWLRIVLPDDAGAVGWVFAELVTTDDDLSLLNTVDPGANPQQAFYFRTGIGDAPCSEAPNSGLLIRTPEGEGEISFTLNEVNIQLGSTAFLQAVPGEEMIVNLLDGRGQIESFGEEQIAVSGIRIRIPLDDQLAASGPPDPPELCLAADLAGVPGAERWTNCDYAVVYMMPYECPATVPSDADTILRATHFGGLFATETELNSAVETSNSSIEINGQSIPVRRITFPHGDEFNYDTEYYWETPDPGVYTITGNDGGGNDFSCIVTVLEPPE